MQKLLGLFLVLTIQFFSVGMGATVDLGDFLERQKEIEGVEINPTPPSGAEYSFEYIGTDGAVSRGTINSYTEKPGRTIFELSFGHYGTFTKSTIQAWDKSIQAVSKQCFELSDKLLAPARKYYVDSLDKIMQTGSGKYKKVFGVIGVTIEAKFFINKTADISVNIWREDNTGWINNLCLDSPSVADIPKGVQYEIAYVSLGDLKHDFDVKVDGKMYTLILGTSILIITIDSKKATYNGKSFELAFAPVFYKGTTYIPLSAFTGKSPMGCTSVGLPTRQEFKDAEDSSFIGDLKCNENTISTIRFWIW